MTGRTVKGIRERIALVYTVRSEGLKGGLCCYRLARRREVRLLGLSFSYYEGSVHRRPKASVSSDSLKYRSEIFTAQISSRSQSYLIWLTSYLQKLRKSAEFASQSIFDTNWRHGLGGKPGRQLVDSAAYFCNLSLQVCDLCLDLSVQLRRRYSSS